MSVQKEEMQKKEMHGQVESSLPQNDASESIAPRLMTLQYNVDETAHIVVDGAHCATCAPHPCLRFCPAKCFTPNPKQGIDYYHAGCVECGACLLHCPRDAVKWEYPRGGFGVNYRF